MGSDASVGPVMPSSFTIGGSVTGLAAGNSLVLDDNGGDLLKLSANGSFVFATPVASGQPYAVSVSTQPSSPAQVCVTFAGTGTVSGGNVSGISITCGSTPQAVALQGTVQGLAPGGTVGLSNNGGPTLYLTSNSAFAFPDVLTAGQAYSVAVVGQPSLPTAQICTLTGATGALPAVSVSSVTVSCANTYSVGGTITGLSDGNIVSLYDNGGDRQELTGNGTFQFPIPVASGASYTVTVGVIAPNPETCTVVASSPVVGSGPVTDVAVYCVPNDVLYYFPFSGDLTDHSGNGFDGNSTGTVTLTADRFGNAKSAYNFDGTTGYIVAPGDLLPTGQADRTLTAWIEPLVDTTQSGIVSWGNSLNGCADDMFGVGIEGGNASFWGGCNDGMSSLSAPTGQWTFVAMVYSGTSNTYTMWVNGQSTTFDLDPASTGAGLLVMGLDPVNQVYFNGNIDSVRVYGRALSDNEISGIYGSPTP